MHTIGRWQRLATWLALLPPTTLVASAALLTSTSGLPAQATVGTNDYPSYLANAAKDSLVDPWDFYNRECTSFVAWRLNNDEGIAFTNHYEGAHFGNAYQWAGAAESVGIPVNGTPAPGSVAVYPSSLPGSGGNGHVAFVLSVNASAGTVTVEEYNFNVVGAVGELLGTGQGLVGVVQPGRFPGREPRGGVRLGRSCRGGLRPGPGQRPVGGLLGSRQRLVR
jgi:surface antigen